MICSCGNKIEGIAGVFLMPPEKPDGMVQRVDICTTCSGFIKLALQKWSTINIAKRQGRIRRATFPRISR